MALRLATIAWQHIIQHKCSYILALYYEWVQKTTLLKSPQLFSLTCKEKILNQSGKVSAH